MNKKKIWLIDENKLEIRASQKMLSRILSGSVDVIAIFPPFSTLQEYHVLLKDPDTASIIIDQRLKDTGIANYTGIELANHLRSIDTKIPLYILTNFAEDFEKNSGRGWSVEDIIDKGRLSVDDDTKMETAARILRRINVFDDILDDREKRFHGLLVKSLSQSLSVDELDELERLQENRASSILADEINQLGEIEKALQKQKDILLALDIKGSDDEK
jgi:hypothetical protein